MPTLFSNLPKGHKICLQCLTSNGDIFVITRDLTELYYLFKVDETNKKKLIKIRTSNNPLKFKEVYGTETKSNE